MDTSALETQYTWLEESFGSTEALIADGDYLAVGKLIGFLQSGALTGGLNFLLEVERDVAKLLLHITNDFTLGRGGEWVAALSQDLHQVIGKITTSHIDTGDGMGKSESLVDGYDVSNTIPRIEHDTCSSSRCIQGEHSLYGHVESWGVEGLKDDLSHLLPIGLGVDGGFRQ